MKKESGEAAHRFVEPGDRTAPETEGVLAGIRAGSRQVHLRAAVIWCREGGEGGGGVGKTRNKRFWD